jgi:hypothetical protein
VKQNIPGKVALEVNIDFFPWIMDIPNGFTDKNSVSLGYLGTLNCTCRTCKIKESSAGGIIMISTLQLKQMTREEKLRALEDIWTDLSMDDNEIVSPSWHDDVLKETNASMLAGQERMEDWQDAKRELRKRFE